MHPVRITSLAPVHETSKSLSLAFLSELFAIARTDFMFSLSDMRKWLLANFEDEDVGEAASDVFTTMATRGLRSGWGTFLLPILSFLLFGVSRFAKEKGRAVSIQSPGSIMSELWRKRAFNQSTGSHRARSTTCWTASSHTSCWMRGKRRKLIETYKVKSLLPRRSC